MSDEILLVHNANHVAGVWCIQLKYARFFAIRNHLILSSRYSYILTDYIDMIAVLASCLGLI